jgi:hypothetical protein
MPARLADRGNGTFTSSSPRLHRAAAAASDTPGMENAGRLLFMAMVTCYLLGRVFSGETTHPETVVYAATAAFGLDFLIASWRALWGPS